MLDLRVVLAACLAAFVFLLAGIGVFATLRIGHKSVAVVRDGGLPPDPARPRLVPRDPRAPVETPAAQVRTEEPVPPPAPETTGSIENVLQVPPPAPPAPPAPLAIEDLLKSLPPAPEPPPALTRVEPVEMPEVKETAPDRAVVAPVLPEKPAAKQVHRAPKVAAKRRAAEKVRARAARRAQRAANPAATAATPPTFFLFNPQPDARTTGSVVQ
jgi:hypothetical protein